MRKALRREGLRHESEGKIKLYTRAKHLDFKNELAYCQENIADLFAVTVLEVALHGEK